MKHSTTTFESRLDDLKNARVFWQAQGYNPANSRIGVYERKLRKLVEMGAEGRSMLTREEAGRVYLLLPEIGDFLFVSKAAASYPRLVNAPRVRKIFSGPELAKDEETATHANPRNTLLELAIAANIELSGLESDLSGVTDVKTTFQGTSIHMECKRPQNLSKAETAIRKAAQQLEVNHTSTSLGVIVVCIGKLITEGERMLVAKDRPSMEARINQETENFINSTQRLWHTKKHVSGILVRVNVPGIIEDVNRPYHAALFTGTNHPDLSAERRKILSNFLRHLQTGLLRTEG